MSVRIATPPSGEPNRNLEKDSCQLLSSGFMTISFGHLATSTVAHVQFYIRVSLVLPALNRSTVTSVCPKPVISENHFTCYATVRPPFCYGYGVNRNSNDRKVQLSRMPSPDTGLSPHDLFTKTRWTQTKFQDLHVWGCPFLSFRLRGHELEACLFRSSLSQPRNWRHWPPVPCRL